jgi:hypothetical protein
MVLYSRVNYPIIRLHIQSGGSRSAYTFGGAFASHADDLNVLGLEVDKEKGTDCGSRE